MNRKKLIITAILGIAILMSTIPLEVYADIYDKLSLLIEENFKETEEQLYKRKLKESKYDLVNELKLIDQNLANSNDKIMATPQVLALIEKSDEFTNEEILNMLKNSNNSELLETALIEMYTKKDGDSNSLLKLFYNSNLSESSKENIIIKSNLTANQLKNICLSYDNSYSAIAMKKLAGIDTEAAYKLSTELLNKSNKSDNDLYIASLGLEKFFSKNKKNFKDKDKILSGIKKEIEKSRSSKDNIVNDRLVYALSKSNDFDSFKYLISNKNIDEDLKVSTIENNVQLMINKIQKGLDKKELEYIAKAMKILPIKEIGMELEKQLLNGKLELSNEISNLIEFIKLNGVEGVFKND